MQFIKKLPFCHVKTLKCSEPCPEVECSVGPLQLIDHIVQKHFAGEQIVHWDIQNKEYLNYVALFGCPNAQFAHQQCVFVPCDRSVAKGLFVIVAPVSVAKLRTDVT